jgi:hypothetical protein
MIAARIILPGICRGGGPPKAVEGFLCAMRENPSTMLRTVPLPTKSWGG